MDLKIKIDDAQIRRLKREFREIPGKSRRALSATLNKTIVGVRTDTVRVVVKEYLVRSGDVRSTLTIRKATINRLDASMRSEGTAIRLIKFRTSPKSATSRRPAGGVRVQVKRSGGGGRISGAFIAVMRNASVGVFVRKGRSRLPIEQLYGPAIPSMIGGDDVWLALETMANQRLAKNLNHEIERILKGFGK